MTESIESISLAVGASLTLPVVAMTGIVGRIRSPYPDPAAEIDPADGSIFGVEVVPEGVKLTGVAEGTGSITLIAGPNSSQRTTYNVVVENNNNTVRWIFGFGGVLTEYTPPPPPLEIDVLVNDQRVQLTFSGTGAEDSKTIDWGDGNVEDTDSNPAQHDYMDNGTYVITIGEWTYTVGIDHYPVYTLTPEDPLVTVTHNKGDISTVVDWGDGTTDQELADSFTHMYAQNGTYEVNMTVGGFPKDSLGGVTITNADLGGASAPPTDHVCYGPFLAGGINFWVCVSATQPQWFSLAIDVDNDPEPDVLLNASQIKSLWDALTEEQQHEILAKIREVRNA